MLSGPVASPIRWKSSSRSLTCYIVYLQHEGQIVQVIESFAGSENGPNPDVLAWEIGEALGAVLEQFREIAMNLSP